MPGAVNRVAAFGLHYGDEGPFSAQFQLRHYGPRDLLEDYFYESRLRGKPHAVADRHFHPVEPRSARLTLRLAL